MQLCLPSGMLEVMYSDLSNIYDCSENDCSVIVFCDRCHLPLNLERGLLLCLPFSPDVILWESIHTPIFMGAELSWMQIFLIAVLLFGGGKGME